jgi:hypothetical protein
MLRKYEYSKSSVMPLRCHHNKGNTIDSSSDRGLQYCANDYQSILSKKRYPPV